MNCNLSTGYQNVLLPENSKYFKEELFSKIFTIPGQKPNIERILNIVTFPEIEDIKLIDTPTATSNEGQHLTGAKLVVEVNIKSKVTYVACEPTQSVHAAHFETLKSMFVIVPREFEGTDICSLFRSNRVNVTPYVEDSCFRMLSCREIYNCSLVFLHVTIC